MMNSPLETAYTRLDEVHRAWHAALTGYHRIEDFRASINSGIQAIRNLTFALQKQKNDLANFDNWYSGWQTKMSTDIILKELSSARTIIVHKEDLKLYSIGSAKIKGWIEFEKLVFEFDPMESSASVADKLYKKKIKESSNPSGFGQGLLFEFERKWIYEKLPEHELLEALAYAYHFFFEMLLDANKTFIIDVKTRYATGDYCTSEFNNKNKLKCMEVTSNERSFKYHFDTGSKLKVEKIGETVFTPSDADLKKSKDEVNYTYRSKDIANLLTDLIPDSHPFDLMRLSAERALTLFKKNKSLAPTFNLFFPNEKKVKILTDPFPSDDQQFRHLFIDEVAVEVIKNNVEFVIAVGKVSLHEAIDNKSLTTNSKNAQNFILITYISAIKGKMLLIPIRKNYLGKFTFSNPSVTDFGIESNSDSMYYFMFNPIVDALRRIVK